MAKMVIPPKLAGSKKLMSYQLKGEKMKYGNVTLGQVEAVWNILGGEEGAQRLLRGETKIVIKTLPIDCDADPFPPEGWKVEEHIKGGNLIWNPEKVELYLCDEQKAGVIEGNKLRKLLKGKSVLNANVLDYLLANPQLIPDEWKDKYILFWGTMYRYPNGKLCVRCLFWRGDRWYWSSNWLGNDFNDDSPAVLSCK